MTPEEKLQSIIQLLEKDKVTHDDLEKFLTMIIEAIQKDKDITQKDKEELLDKVAVMENQLSTLISQNDEKWSKIMSRVSLLKDGVSPDKNEIIREVVSLIPRPKDGKPGLQGSPDTPEAVRDKLSSLEGEERLDKSAIKGLKEELETLSLKIPRGYTGGGTRSASVQYHDLSASLNGVTKTFTIPKHKKIVGVWCSSTPGVMRPTVDFTMSGNNMTFTSEIDAASTLATGQTVIVLYGQLFGP